MKKEQLLVFQIKCLNNQIRRLLERSSLHRNDANLTGMQYAILGFISDHRDYHDVYQKDIEKEFNIRRSTASAMVKSLEQGDYLQRENSSEDARLKKITLTAKGEEMHKIARQNMERLHIQLTQGISEEEMKQFYRVLKKISDNAQK